MEANIHADSRVADSAIEVAVTRIDPIGPVESFGTLWHDEPYECPAGVSLPNARQVFRYRDVQGDVTVEMIIWALPKPTPDRLHGLKYRLYCGKDGRCVVRYDNETGKGDHRHYGRREEAYAFESVEKLLADFETDCERLAGWVWE